MSQTDIQSSGGEINLQVQAKLRCIDESLVGTEFLGDIAMVVDRFLQEGRVIDFSRLVCDQKYTGIYQLMYEKGRYCFGENDGSTTELEESHKIRLDYASQKIGEALIKRINLKGRGDYQFSGFIHVDENDDGPEYVQMNFVYNPRFTDRKIKFVRDELDRILGL